MASSTPALHADDTAPATAQPLLQLLCFAVADGRFALRIEAVREILEVSRTTPLPLMPDFVRGVMNLRGAVVPVIDLGARLGLPAATIGRRSCVVIVDAVSPEHETAQRLGLLVDAVYEVFDVAAHEFEAVPRLGTVIDPAFLRNMVRVRGQAVPELNIDTVLDLAALSALVAGDGTLH